VILPVPPLSPGIVSAGTEARRVADGGREDPRGSERGEPAGRELVGFARGAVDAFSGAFSTGFLASGSLGAAFSSTLGGVSLLPGRGGS
jgi:hypothetical protein